MNQDITPQPGCDHNPGDSGERAPSVAVDDPYWLQAVLMAAVAFFVGIGVPSNNVYAPGAMVLLTCGLLCCFASITISKPSAPMKWKQRVLPAILVAGILVQTVILIFDSEMPLPEPIVWAFDVRLAAAGILGILGLVRSPMVRGLRATVLAIIFFILASTVIKVYRQPLIDVFMFQTRSAKLLMRGGNPFDSRQAQFPNVYPKEGAEFLYGHGVVDFTPTPASPGGTLRHGFPYMPVSLLLIIPGQILGGDIRYSSIAAILISALLMAFARPGVHSPLAACLFLFTPPVFYVVREAWTEPLLILTFSIAMFCSCRFPRMFPYALGIFLATKQYTILIVPVAILLNASTFPKGMFKPILKALAVAAAVTIPLALWNFREFWGSVVDWQFAQPFRMDSCSYLVTIAMHANGWHAPFWTPFAFAIPAICLVLWRGTRTPAGFAAGAAFVCLVFFLFNKQAFTNYYYFVIGAACWAVAASGVKEDGLNAPSHPTGLSRPGSPQVL